MFTTYQSTVIASRPSLSWCVKYKYCVGASFYAEGSGPLSLVNESKKKLKYRLGSWGRPSKEVTFTSRPEGWTPDSPCSVFLWLWEMRKESGICQPQSCTVDALWPASSGGGRCRADTEVTCRVLLQSVCNGENQVHFTFSFILWSIMWISFTRMYHAYLHNN